MRGQTDNGGEPMFNLPPAVLVFVFLSGAIFVGQTYYLHADSADTFFLTFSFIPWRYAADAVLPGGVWARVWTPVSYVFLNVSLSSLVFEMLWTMAFGSALAFRVGSLRFVLFSAAAAVVGAGVFYLISPQSQSVLYGPDFMISAQLGASVRFVYQAGFAGMMSGGNDRWNVPALGIVEMWSNENVLRLFGIIFLINAFFSFLIGGGEGVIVSIMMNLLGYIAGILLFSIFDRDLRNRHR